MRPDNQGSDALHPDGDGRDLVECHECGRNYKCVDNSDSWMEVWASE